MPLTADPDGPRVPRRSGRHVFTAGGTGSGKTTIARCAPPPAASSKTGPRCSSSTRRATRTPRRSCAASPPSAGVPFILLDPHAPDSDHWQPLWGERPAEVVAGVLSGIEASEPYYIDALRLHVGIVASVLHAGGYWPPSFPLLVEAAQLEQFDRVVALAAQHKTQHPELYRRVKNHQPFVESPEGAKALARRPRPPRARDRRRLAPRPHPPPPSQTGSSSASASPRRSASTPSCSGAPTSTRCPTKRRRSPPSSSPTSTPAPSRPKHDGPALWTVVLDEFGAVITTAGDQALALLQRGRTHEGQVHVITQSVADIEALTGQTGLLASMTDNFTAFIIHRQASPESRDWLAKLMGTTALWQSTDQTSGHNATGTGTRRRVRRVPRQLRHLRRAADRRSRHPHHARPAARQVTRVKQLKLAVTRPRPDRRRAPAATCEMTVHPATELPPADANQAAAPKATPPASDPSGRVATAPARARRERPSSRRQLAPEMPPAFETPPASETRQVPPSLPGHAL